MKKLALKPHLSTQELYRRYRACKTVQESRRWHILWLLSINTSINAIVAATGMSRTWIWRICTRYNMLGSDGVKRQQKRRSGAQPILNTAQYAQLCHALAQPPARGGRWTSQKVADWIREHTGRQSVATRTGWIYLSRWRNTQQVALSLTQQIGTNQANYFVERQSLTKSLRGQQ